MNPRFPIYIPSKGRYGKRLTSKYLTEYKVFHNIIIEEHEYSKYKTAIGVNKYVRLLILDKEYQRNYEPMCKLKKGESQGSGPARNFGWDHSVSEGYKYHWMVDDNIDGFWRWNNNRLIRVSDGTIFNVMEDFSQRYNNVYMSGPNYFMFASRKSKGRPFTPNTRIYSCNLIRNDIPYRWRCRYNEDTDLSLRILKDGYCTILFNAFLQYKQPTLSMPGGNTEAIYKNGANKKAKSQMIADLHPDIARVVWKFNRWHHHVDYTPFKKNRLKKKKGIRIKKGINEYGMELKEINKE